MSICPPLAEPLVVAKDHPVAATGLQAVGSEAAGLKEPWGDCLSVATAHPCRKLEGPFPQQALVGQVALAPQLLEACPQIRQVAPKLPSREERLSSPHSEEEGAAEPLPPNLLAEHSAQQSRRQERLFQHWGEAAEQD